MSIAALWISMYIINLIEMGNVAPSLCHQFILLPIQYIILFPQKHGYYISVCEMKLYSVLIIQNEREKTFID